jgi:hypothetical protein
MAQRHEVSRDPRLLREQHERDVSDPVPDRGLGVGEEPAAVRMPEQPPHWLTAGHEHARPAPPADRPGHQLALPSDLIRARTDAALPLSMRQ